MLRGGGNTSVISYYVDSERERESEGEGGKLWEKCVAFLILMPHFRRRNL